MTRRMIDSSLWSNENFAKLPAMGRLLQLAMINHADDQGRCKAHPVYLRSQAFPYESVEVEQIQVWLSLMVLNGTILLYQADGKDYVQFLNWWEYQTLVFAQPSDYPAPDGWQDRIRFNGKGNITLTHNWQKADGTAIEDTCDARGKPLPLVEAMAPKNHGGRPAKQGENSEEKVSTFQSTFPPTFRSTFDGGKVNKDQVKDQDQLEGEGGRESGYAAPAPTSPAKGEDAALKPGQLLYRSVCEILGWDYKTLSTKNQVQIAEAVKKLMAANYTCNELDRFMGDVWADDWRWQKKKQRPTLDEFQAEVGKLRAAVPDVLFEKPAYASPKYMSKVDASLAAIDEYERIKAKHGVES